jgi:hypothetical protein
MIAAFIARALRDPDYPTNFADAPPPCPYDRPFEHAADCGCDRCERHASRAALRVAVLALLIISIVLFGISL